MWGLGAERLSTVQWLALPSTASVSIADADYQRLLQLPSGRLVADDL